MAEDHSLRHDTTFLRAASEDELRAEELIRKIRAEEDKSLWSIEHEGISSTFAGMEFLSGKHRNFWDRLAHSYMRTSKTFGTPDENLQGFISCELYFWISIMLWTERRRCLKVVSFMHI